MFRIAEIMSSGAAKQYQTPDGPIWVPALPWKPRTRLRDAIAVFLGRAEAVQWPDQTTPTKVIGGGP